MKDKLQYAADLAFWALTVGLLLFGAAALFNSITEGSP